MAKFNVDKPVESIKPFLPEERHKFINLCILTKVSVKMMTPAAEDQNGVPSTYEYAGIEIPTLVFEFKQIRPEGDDTERVSIYTEKPCVINKKDGGVIADKDIKMILDQMFDRILHIHNSLKKNVNYKEMKNSEVPELKETVAVPERLASYTAFFQYIADSFNIGKNNLPIYKDEKGKPVLLWLKLIANYPDGKYLTLPTFVGKGFIEMFNIKYPHSSLTFDGKETYVTKSGTATTTKSSGANGASAAEPAGDEISKDLQDILDGKM